MLRRLFFISLFLTSACSQAPIRVFTPGPPVPSLQKLPVPPPINHKEKLKRIAFGSCSDQTKPQPLWKIVRQQKPQLWLSLGDIVYANKPHFKPFSKAYALQAEHEDFAPVRNSIPMLGTWDDGEYGISDAGAENPDKELAKASFLAFLPNSAALINSGQGGLYHSTIIGPPRHRVQIIALDTRYYRDQLEKNPQPQSHLEVYQPTQDTAKTMLGEEQWKWLEQELLRPAEVRIILSSIQLISSEHGLEKWANLPHEQQRFYDLLSKLKINNAIVLSGDRHLGEISKITLLSVGDLYDITASSINRPASIRGEKNSARVGNAYPDENFGLIDINWSKGRMTIKLLGSQGQVVASVQKKIKFN